MAVLRKPAGSTSIPSNDLLNKESPDSMPGPRQSMTWLMWLGAASLVMTFWIVYPDEADPMPEKLSAITWNMAAINNNPFEYWITHEDKAYNQLMEDVSEFINDPKDKDVPISSVFTQGMFDELCESMTGAGWGGVEEVKQRWHQEYKDRKIISEFIKDGLIGKKRLASMPDRYTNTINTNDGGTVMRPTVINCYQGDLGSTAKWWKAWRTFMFEAEVTVKGRNGVETKPIRSMLSKIKNAKYPAITPEEEAISIPLQAMAGAVFDAILIHMMNTLAPANWQPLREDMCEKLNRRKNDRTIDILETTYGSVDVQFLQEVAGAFIEKATPRPLSKTLFDVYFPEELDGDRDQNSLILLRKGAFEPRSVVEVTKGVKEVGQSKGDLFVVTADSVATSAEKGKGESTKYLFASFHGDTNGLLTIPVVTAVHEYASAAHPDRKLVFGMDANTYEIPDPGNKQDVEGFADFYTKRGLNSCYGPTPNPKNYTTFHARTYLQPQLNKAIKFSEKDVKGDKNPKDFVVFDQKDFAVRWTKKDNTGAGMYVEGMVFPTLAFPSDHGITATSLATAPPPAAASAGSPKLRG